MKSQLAYTSNYIMKDLFQSSMVRTTSAICTMTSFTTTTRILQAFAFLCK